MTSSNRLLPFTDLTSSQCRTLAVVSGLWLQDQNGLPRSQAAMHCLHLQVINKVMYLRARVLPRLLMPLIFNTARPSASSCYSHNFRIIGLADLIWAGPASAASPEWRGNWRHNMTFIPGPECPEPSFPMGYPSTFARPTIPALVIQR